MKKIKLFHINLELTEVLEEDPGLFPLFSTSRIVLGADQIKSVLDIFSNQIQNFINLTINNNNLKKIKKEELK